MASRLTPVQIDGETIEVKTNSVERCKLDDKEGYNMETQDARIAERIVLCKRERRANDIWLEKLTPVNFMLVGVGGVMSLVAGLSIITKAEINTQAAG